MTHFFERRDRWGNGFAVWIVMAMIFAAPFGWFALRQIRLENDVETWLPQNDPELKVLRWARQQFPTEDRVLVTWDGSSLNDLRIDKFVETLLGHTDADGVRHGGLPHVSGVIEPRPLLATMQKQGVDPQEAVRRLEGVLLGAGSLKLRLTEFGKSRLRRTRQELTAEAKSRFGIELNFSDPSPDFTTTVSIPIPQSGEGEPTSGFSAPLVMGVDGNLRDNATVDHDLQVVWKGMRPASEQTGEVAEWFMQFVPPKGEGATLVERCFYAPGSPVMLSLLISQSGIADQSETVEVIKQAAVSVGIPLDTLHLGGSVVSAAELNQDVTQAAWDESRPWNQIHRRSVILTSLVVGIILAYVLIRDIRLATMVLAVSLYAAFMALAFVPATGGSMNMVIMVMPTLIMVLTISRAIYLVNDWKHAACAGESTTIVQTVWRSWRPCAIASLTTAIGLACLCTSDLAPVREFGIYAAIGTIFSAIMVLYALPSLLQIWPERPPQKSELDHSGWRLLGRGLTTWPLFQSLVFLSICVVCSYGLTKFRAETKVIRYFPESSRISRDYWFIETYLAGLMPIESIIRFDARSQQETNFLDRMEFVREIAERMRRHPEISGAISLADFQPVSERPETDANFLTRGKYNKKSGLTQLRISGGEIPLSKAFYNVSQEGYDRNRKGDNKLNQPGDELWRISAQVAVMTDNDLTLVLNDVNELTQDVLKRNPGALHILTGTVPLFLRTQKAVLESLVSSLALAFVLILAVFVVVLKNFWAGLVAMIPNLVPITVVFGAISWFGGRIDIGTMLAASLALGIAVDGTLYYLTGVRRELNRNQTRREAIIQALAHSGPALLQARLALAIGLLVFIPAELLPISRFGWMMAAMIGVALLVDVVFLSQLLAGPLGGLFEPKRGASNNAEQTPSDTVRNDAQELKLSCPSEKVKPLYTGAPLPAPHLKSLDSNSTTHKP